MQSKKTIMIIDDNELIVDTMSIYFDDDYNIIKFGGFIVTGKQIGRAHV